MVKKPKILWLNNLVMPNMAESFGIKPGISGGWTVGLFSAVKATNSVDLIVVFPMYGKTGVLKRDKDGTVYYGVGVSLDYQNYHTETEAHFKEIIKTEQPDMVHVFGSEFPHTLAMVRAFENPKKTVISVQGLTSVIPLHYLEGIPTSVVRAKTLREWLSGRGLVFERSQFSRRGLLEAEAIANTGHIIGRTDWDKACTEKMNPKAEYHHCYESLRDSFYQASWDIEKIERHSLLVSQGAYPLKGLHMALEAVADLKHDFPDIKLYVGGDPVGNPAKTGFKRILNAKSYPRYIERLIAANNLADHVVFLGSLNEDEMRERLLKTHVFVSASLVENSPNSVGEANLLGVPCVSSHVGGVAEMMVHEKEGYVYQSTAPYMLAHFIKKLFNSDETAVRFSKASREHAKTIYDRKNNGKRMVEIYQYILGGNR